VKDVLRRSLAGKRPTLQDVARELGLGARTFQRRLTDAGITFQQLVEETRRDLAHHYLKQSKVELNEAAFLLGFEDAIRFFRAFQAWEGTSPSEWRTRHGAAAKHDQKGLNEKSESREIIISCRRFVLTQKPSAIYIGSRFGPPILLI